MNKFFFVCLGLIGLCLPAAGQDRSLLYLGPFTNDSALKTLSDSLQKPLLVTQERVYAIGSLCISRLFGGDNNNRDMDGADNDRNRSGSNDQRVKAGNSDDRNKGGGIDDRNKSGSGNQRVKNGDNDERNKSGDSDDRNKTGEANNRNADGGLSKETGCANDRSGKILLYVRSDINTKKSRIYFKDQFFSTRYFQIIPL